MRQTDNQLDVYTDAIMTIQSQLDAVVLDAAIMEATEKPPEPADKAYVAAMAAAAAMCVRKIGAKMAGRVQRVDKMAEVGQAFRGLGEKLILEAQLLAMGVDGKKEEAKPE